jgi:MEDS: MEthanogen/methylotroph, DcmR Sensory domain
MTPPHAVQFYNDDVFLIDTVSAFITAGLKENGAIIVIATAQHREELRNTLQAANNSSITYIDAVELLSAFMVDDWPNATRFTSTVGPLLQRAALKGPVRIFGEMAAVLWAEGKTQAAIRLEELGNELASQHAFSLLCAYPMSGFPDQKNNLPFLQICRAHTHVYPAQ